MVPSGAHTTGMVRSAGSEGPEGRDSQAERAHTCVSYHSCPGADGDMSDLAGASGQMWP